MQPDTETRAPALIAPGQTLVSFCGRCWIRTNVGEADGFTDRSLWPLGQPAKPADLRPLAGRNNSNSANLHQPVVERPPPANGCRFGRMTEQQSSERSDSRGSGEFVRCGQQSRPARGG